MILFNERGEAEKILDFFCACDKLELDGQQCLAKRMAALKNKQTPPLRDTLVLLHKVNEQLLTQPTSIAFTCDNRQQVLYTAAKYLWQESKKSAAKRSDRFTALFQQYRDAGMFQEKAVYPTLQNLDETGRTAKVIMCYLNAADQSMTALSQLDRLNQMLIKSSAEYREKHNLNIFPEAEAQITIAGWLKLIPQTKPPSKKSQTKLDVFDNQASLLSITIKAFHDAAVPEESGAAQSEDAQADAEVPAEWAKAYPPEEMLLYLLTGKMADNTDFRALPLPQEKIVVYGDRALKASKTFYDRIYQCREKPLIELKPFFNLYHIRRTDVQEPEADNTSELWMAPAAEPYDFSIKKDACVNELIDMVLKQARWLYTLQAEGCEPSTEKRLKLVDDGANGLYLALNRAYTVAAPRRRSNAPSAKEYHKKLISSLMMPGKLPQPVYEEAVIALEKELGADLTNGTLQQVQPERNLILNTYAVENFRTNSVMQMLLYLAMQSRGTNPDTGCPWAICELQDAPAGDDSKDAGMISGFIRDGLQELKDMTAKEFLDCRKAAVEGGMLHVTLRKKEKDGQRTWTAKIEEHCAKTKTDFKQFLGRQSKEKALLKNTIEYNVDRVPFRFCMWIQQGLTQIKNQELRGNTKPFYAAGSADYTQRTIFLLVLWVLKQYAAKDAKAFDVTLTLAEKGSVFICGEKKVAVSDVLAELWQKMKDAPDSIDDMWDSFCTNNIIKTRLSETGCVFTMKTKPV